MTKDDFTKVFSKEGKADISELDNSILNSLIFMVLTVQLLESSRPVQTLVSYTTNIYRSGMLGLKQPLLNKNHHLLSV